MYDINKFSVGVNGCSIMWLITFLEQHAPKTGVSFKEISDITGFQLIKLKVNIHSSP